MDEPLYRIKVSAQMVGLSEQLLRAWERRYQLVVPQRSASGYRGYSATDIELLKRIKQLTEEGISIGDVAPLMARLRKEARAAVSAAAEPEGAPVSAGDRIEAWHAAILDAAHASSQPQVEAVLDQALAALPALQVLEELMMPVQRDVGEQWHRGELSVAQEHLVSHVVRSRLFSLIHGAPKQTRRHALCACFPLDEHDIGLLGAALRLRHTGYRVTYLGGRTPVDQLVEMAQRLKPEVIALSSTTPMSKAAFRRTLQQWAGRLGRARVVLGGAGAELFPGEIAAAGAELVRPPDWSALTRW